MANQNGNGKKKRSNQKSDDGALPKSLFPKLDKLTPQQLAVITALLTNALKVDSVLVDRNQTIQIVLEGTLRRKNKTDKLVEQLSELSVGELLNAIMRNQG